MPRLSLLLPLLALVTLTLPALAADPLFRRLADAENIPVEEWTALATGRTLTYQIDGAFWALEHYYPGTDRVTLQLYDGTCLEGTWDYSFPRYCFHWLGEDSVCFRHARLGGDILIIEQQGGQDTPMLQRMTAVTDVPLACGPAVVG